MELNYEDIVELRNKVKKKLLNTPNGVKIELDEEILNILLFDYITINKKTGEVVKLPVWSGEFLSKLKLQHVSFENVAWSLQFKKGFDMASHNYLWTLLDSECIQLLRFKYCLDENSLVNYSNTDAIIDFSNSFEGKHRFPTILFCDFSNTDLSNNDMTKVKRINHCNLSNTGIVFTQEFCNRFTKEEFGNNNFSNNNFSHITIDGFNLLFDNYTCIFNSKCNFSNTELRITIDYKRLTNETYGAYIENQLRVMLRRGFLVNCYLNGKKILPEKVTTNNKDSEYDRYKKGLFTEVNKSIEEQIKASLK
jgi:uncharacterized protein YjbI with pentapeptide repeats